MRLPDNLKKIRKENNLSQEQLAEKLGVSRQAVSKWESGQSYPEMDKVLMICKLFNYNIDELMNENVKEVSENKQSKVNFNKYIDDFFAYITKTIRMFESMKFSQKIKCIIEQIIVALCIITVMSIIGVILGSIFSGIFSWMPSGIYITLAKILESVYLIFSLIVGVVILLHIFKLRYLDYYEIVEEKEESEEREIVTKENNSEEKSKILLEKNKEKIIIRDPVHSESRFLNGILKIIVFGIKAFVGFCGLGFIFTLAFLCIGLMCSLLFVKTGFVFVGAFICISAGIVGNIVILEIIYNFIISKKNAKTRISITLLVSVIAIGIGIGIILIGCTKFNYIDEVDENLLQEKTITFPMTDDLSISVYENAEYIASDNNDVRIVVEYSNSYNPSVLKDNNGNIYIHYNSSNENIFETIRIVIEDINNKQIKNYNYLKIYVYTTQENIDKIKYNAYYEDTKVEEYEQEIQNLNDIIDGQHEKIYEQENRINELEEILEEYRYQ